VTVQPALDPNFYDVGSVKTAMPSNKFTNMYIYLTAASELVAFLGQFTYNTLDAAESGIQLDTPSFPALIIRVSVLRAIISIRQGTTDLTDASDVRIFDQGKFGNLGVASALGMGTHTALQITYDSSGSGLTATNVHDALHELDANDAIPPTSIQDGNDSVGLSSDVLTVLMDAAFVPLQCTGSNTRVGQSLSIGSAVNVYAALNAVLDCASTTRGFFPPRMTTTQRDAIVAGAGLEGMVVYNTTTNVLNFHNGTSWGAV